MIFKDFEHSGLRSSRNDNSGYLKQKNLRSFEASQVYNSHFTTFYKVMISASLSLPVLPTAVTLMPFNLATALVLGFTSICFGT